MSLGCDIHGGRNLCLYFCYDCDMPACSVCLLHEHGPAPAVTSPSSSHGGKGAGGGGHRTAKLRDALAARRDALKTLLNAFGPPLDRLESKARRLSGGSVVMVDGGGGLRGSRNSTAIKLDDQPSLRPASTPAASNSENVPLIRHPQKQVRSRLPSHSYVRQTQRGYVVFGVS